MKRIWIISVGFLIFAAVLLCRLIYLQVFCYDELSVKADTQKFYGVELEEIARGNIYDRNGISITAEEETLSLLVVPFLVDDPVDFSRKVSEAFDLSEDKLLSGIENSNEHGEGIRKEPFIVKTDLDSSGVKKAEEMDENGIYVISTRGRYYRDFPAQHLIGSLEKNEKGQFAEGVSGFERIYDDVLSSGSIRKISFLIDEKNRMIDPNEYYVDESNNGNVGYIKTTIDLNIQRAAEAALGDHSGAVVVLDSSNGDVLALVSSPKYDPYFMSDLKSDDVYVNKAFSAFPPASLFKIFIAAEALEEGIVAPESTFFCNGGYLMNNGSFVSCWETNGHGFLTFEDSLACSCNPVFVKTSLDLGAMRIEKAFVNWELNQDELWGYPLDDLSGIDVSNNSEAVVANIGLGENGVFMMPLTVAKMINVIAAGGMLYTPRVVTQVYDNENQLVSSYENSMPKRVLSKETAETVTGMMVKTFQNGTAEQLNLGEFNIAGKTGTSETGNVWIGGFFPYDDPKYTVVVLVNDGVSGAANGGPIMKKLCAYLGNLS